MVGVKKTPFKKPSKGLSRKSGIKKKGKSEASKTKSRIQSLLRTNAIKRDGECVLRQYENLLPSAYFECGPRRQDGEIVVQAEHLVGRKNSVCYGDMNNIVLLCMRHHFHFKRQHGALYWHMVRLIIGEDRWEKIQEWERQEHAHEATRMYASDWRKIEEDLTQLQQS